jgi:hypothetical protein
MNIKDCIKGNVTFEFYRKGFLYYICENGFQFRVPTDDCGDACFLNKDKGILFMRYIRKELQERNNEA